MKHLQRDLDRLKKEILGEGAMVERAINDAIRSLLERDQALARQVMEGDAEMDEREVGVEEDCLKILALHQPVAHDLRFIIAVLKVNNDLERMGDFAVNIAERAMFLAGQDPIPRPLNFPEMTEKVRAMVRGSLDALITNDPVLARKICADDDEVDAMHREMYYVTQDVMRTDPEFVERAVHTLSVSRHLERIADLATNIAEDVVFMVDGEIIRHRTEDFRNQTR